MLQKIFSPSLILFVHHFHTNMFQIKQILVLDRNTEHRFYEVMKSLFKNSIFFIYSGYLLILKCIYNDFSPETCTDRNEGCNTASLTPYISFCYLLQITQPGSGCVFLAGMYSTFTSPWVV